MRVLLITLVLLTLAGADERPLRVCATTPDLGHLAETIGGDQVELTVFTRGPEDPHFVEAKPSFLRALNRADLLFLVGLDLEIGWLPALHNNARNADVLPDGAGYVDCSAGIALKDVPAVPVDRSMGDVHARGNPHYLLDPENAGIVALRVRDALARARPEERKRFEARTKEFLARLDRRAKDWAKALEPHRGASVVTDHRAWTYFLDRYGLKLAGTLEPKPGVRPGSRHLARLIRTMRREKVRVVLTVPYFNRRYPRLVADKTGAEVVVLAHQTGALDGTEDYIAMMDKNVRLLTQALKE